MEALVVKAKSSRLVSIASTWNFADIKKYIEDGHLERIVMLVDRSLFVAFTSVPATKFKSPAVYEPFIVTPEAASYEHFLKLSELEQPGQEKSFIQPLSNDEIWSVEFLTECHLNECILSVELTEKGDVEFSVRTRGDSEIITIKLNPDKDSGKFLIKEAGITSQGQSVEFPKAVKRYQEFLETGKEERGQNA